ncbi:MAG: HlyD family secretion protein [Bryobacteraceae bacterium]|jgi:membrane fusion protein (multidrug efflux system)
MPETEERPAVAEPERKSPVRFVVVILLVIAIGVGVWAYFHYRNRVSTDDAEVDGHITSIAPKISGNVVDVLVNDNQPVKAGDVLVRIDPRDYQARVDQAKAALAEEESKLRAAQVGVPLTDLTTESGQTLASAGVADTEAELDRARLAYEEASSSDLAYAEANVRARQASNDRAQADLARMKPLVDKAEISQLQYDAYVASAKVADSELKAAQEKLASARKDAAIKEASLAAAGTRVAQAKAQLSASVANRKQVAVRTADVGTAQAAIEDKRAALEAAELQLSYTTITAPIDGVVTHKSVEVGQMLQPGQGIMALIPLNDTWVVANFKETQLAQVHAGQRAEVQVDMYSTTVDGHVDSISGATGASMSLLPPENATGNFVKVVQRIPVKIVVDQRKGVVLRPGMNVDVTIYTK